MSTIVRYKLNDIKKKIKKKEFKQYWFLITPKKSVLVAKANKKNEAKDIVKEKVDKKPEKYERKIFRRFQIKFRDEKNTLINSGSILVSVDHLEVVNGKLKEVFLKGKEGLIWFTKEWLELKGWNKKYIVKMTENIRKKKVNVSALGTNRYEEFDKIVD
jgi:hypothetical protein